MRDNGYTCCTSLCSNILINKSKSLYYIFRNYYNFSRKGKPKCKEKNSRFTAYSMNLFT